jgi:hypothetical protein
VIITFLSLVEPSQAVIGTAVGSLLILLIASQLIDYEGSSIKSLALYIHAFTLPLLVLFSLVFIVNVIRGIFS